MTARACALLMVVVFLRSCAGEYLSQSLRPGPNAVIPPLVQDQDQEDSSDQHIPNYRMANMQSLMLQLLQRVANDGQQQHYQQQQQVAVPPQLPEYLVEESNQGLSDDSSTFVADQEKRGSYMTICHYKICNMGRKRNLVRSPQPMWNRM